ncbi:MAG: carboxypeptidase-like regulatory domain-containing protein, partial [Vicinamibacterales bacterium]|nr:carboxypeptidase-like regulatory domain-containing protein [Vicinamibacterales bacterium]
MRRFPARKLKRACVAGLSLAFILMVGAQASAQGRQYGTLRGTAKDVTDSILPGVTIEVTSEALQGTRTTVTDLNGNYQI